MARTTPTGRFSRRLAAIVGGAALSSICFGSSWAAAATLQPGAVVAQVPLTASALQKALTAAGASVAVQASPPAGFNAIEITVKSPTTPPAFTASGSKATTSSTTAVKAWVIWSATTPVDSLVDFAPGLAGAVDPTYDADYESVVAEVAQAADAALFGDPTTLGANDPDGGVVVGVEYRTPTAFEPDVFAEDSASAVAVLQKALASALPTAGVAKLARSIAVGQSEGGAVTGLMIEHHPGLVQSWIDDEGATDVLKARDQLEYDAAHGLDDPQDIRGVILNAIDTELGISSSAPDPKPCSSRVAAVSPSCQPQFLKGLTQATVIHAQWDAIVPYPVATEMVGQLTAPCVHASTLFATVVPADPSDAELLMSWHSSQDGTDYALGTVNFDVHGHVNAAGPAASTAAVAGYPSSQY